VISLVPSLTEYANVVCPEKVIGVSNWCDAALVTKKLPKVGDYAGLDYEKIIALNPKEVWMLKGFSSPEQVKKLKELNIEVKFFKDQTMEDVLNIPVQMDSIKGKNIKDSLENELSKLISQKIKAKPSYLIFIANDPIQVYGNSNYLSELLDTIGFESAVKNIEIPYPILDNEYFVQHLPQILVSSNVKETKQFLTRKFSEKIIESILFIEIDDNTLTRSGPNFLKVGVTFLKEWNQYQTSKQKTK
jgi:vitamin B12 transport system substrate-binding protein